MGNVSLKSLGEKHSISGAYLGQLFRKKYGISFKDYLNVLRINEAARCISCENQMVKYAAKSVGYKNMDYFTKKIYRAYGNDSCGIQAEIKKKARKA